MKKMKQDAPVKIDERNSAALGIFSMLSRESSERRRWHSQFTVAGRSYDVSGDASLGRPHGADVNIMLGIEQLFQGQGCPDDNFVHTSASELRDASLLAANGRNLKRLREGLDRIWETNITVTRGWHLPDGRTLERVQKMRLINDLRYWVHSGPATPAEREMVPGATLSIQLGAHFADSIRQGFTQNLQLEILRRIEQPAARNLYRLLEAHRYDPDGLARDELSVNLEDWRHACGLEENRPSRYLRALENPHEELVAHQYLRDVAVSESGAGTVLRYAFRAPDEPDLNLVQLLIGSGVAPGAARDLAAQYPDRVEESVRLSQALQRAGEIRRPGAFTRDIILHPDKYAWPEPTAPVAVSRPPAAPVSVQAEQDRRDEERRRAELEAASPQLQWEETRKSLQLLLKTHLSAEQWVTLEGDCLSGRRSAAQLRSALVSASFNLTLQHFIDDLKQDLSAPAHVS